MSLSEYSVKNLETGAVSYYLEESKKALVARLKRERPPQRSPMPGAKPESEPKYEISVERKLP